MDLDTAFYEHEGGQPLEDSLELWDAEIELESASAFLEQANSELQAYMQRQVQDLHELEVLSGLFNLALARVNIAIEKLNSLN
jgi:hypothetical protein